MNEFAKFMIFDTHINYIKHKASNKKRWR